MSFAETFAAHLARAVDLFRDPEKKEDQKREFRALVTMLQEQGATVQAVGGRISVNGDLADGPQLHPLLQRLRLHGGSQLTIPAGVHQLPPPPETPNTPAPPPPPSAPTFEPPPPELEPPPIVRDAAPAVFVPAAARTQDTLDALVMLEREPQGPGVGDTLAVLVRQADEAARASKFERVLRIICGIVRIEQTIAGGTGRRTYSIALKRMFTRSMLEALAQFLTLPGYRADAIVALQRAGADGAEVLLDRLIAAPSMDERRHVFSALAQMKEGAGQLVHLLGHPQWFVVRNSAELVGELGVADAVPELAKQLDHEDERVRKAVALALAKIGSRYTAEPLRRALRDPSPEVRLQVALGVGGRRSSPLAMLLTGALEEEKEVEVVRELVLALGRIGSPEAVPGPVQVSPAHR